MNHEIGDVFSFPITGSDQYGVCQIVNRLDEYKMLTVAVFDWFSNHPPTLEPLKHCEFMQVSFYFWDDLLVRNVSLPIPSQYQWLGNFEPKERLKSSYYNYHDWDFSNIMYRQWQWNQLPTAITKRFRDNRKNKNPITTLGLLDTITNEPAKIRMNATSTFSDSRFIITQDFDLKNLDEWALLNELELACWYQGLMDFLIGHPLINDLTLFNHQQSQIDFSQTYLTDLNIEAKGLKSLLLPASLTRLVLQKADTINEPIEVQAKDFGQAVELQSKQVVPKIKGLQNLKELRIFHINQLDIADIVAYYPNVTAIMLSGNVGQLNNIHHLALLKNLESIWLIDLFGYLAEDFPLPEALPNLKMLDLESLDEVVAKHIKKIYKQSEVMLSVKKPRKPEWLAKNKNNPFRHWEGEDNFPKVAVKKIGEAYGVAYDTVSKAEDITKSVAYEAQVSQVIVDFLKIVGKYNRKYLFLDTLARDEVCMAVDGLMEKMSPNAQQHIVTVIETELDD